MSKKLIIVLIFHCHELSDLMKGYNTINSVVMYTGHK
jgi:hypothetical protein